MLGQMRMAQTKMAQSSGDNTIYYPEWTIKCPSITPKWVYEPAKRADTKKCNQELK